MHHENIQCFVIVAKQNKQTNKQHKKKINTNKQINLIHCLIACRVLMLHQTSQNRKQETNRKQKTLVQG